MPQGCRSLLKSAKMKPQRRPRAPFGCQSAPQGNPKVSKGVPKGAQGAPREPEKRLKSVRKAAQMKTKPKIKSAHFSKLGFVHRRTVFEPPQAESRLPLLRFRNIEKANFREISRKRCDCHAFRASPRTCLGMGTRSAFQEGEFPKFLFDQSDLLSRDLLMSAGFYAPSRPSVWQQIPLFAVGLSIVQTPQMHKLGRRITESSD